ncbi:MAG: LptF/LptG family permease, partial [Pseudomonadota bacterium]
MAVTTRYLCGHLFVRVLGALIVLTALALLFDLLDAGDDLLDDGVSGIRDLFAYIGLRLPSLVSQMMPVACLTGSLISITALLRHRELVVLWAFGHSPHLIMSKLIPIMLLLSAIQFVIDDQLVPPTLAELRAWQVGQFKGQLSGTDGQYLWMRSGQDILRFPMSIPDVDKLENVTIFRRDAEGMLESRWQVEQASRETGGWRLDDITIIRPSEADEHLESMLWEVSIDTEQLALLAAPPRELSLQSLITIIDADAY